MSVGFGSARLFSLILGAGVLGGVVLPALVAGTPGAAGPGAAVLTLPAEQTAATVGAADAGQQEAVTLLRRAAAAGNDRTYGGTQFVTSWSGAGATSVVVDVQHLAGRGVLVRLSSPGDSSAVDNAGAAALDPRALAVLERHYTLSVSAQDAQCAQRPARVVVARPIGSSAVAGRFWLDKATGLVLGRELYDRAGRTIRAAAFVDLRLSVPQPWTRLARNAATDQGAPLSAAAVVDLRRDGWRAPARLTGGAELFDARLHAQVLHLSYTDGLFAISVFSQHGRLNPDSVKGWQHTTLVGTAAWTRPGLSQRVVWTGGLFVYTAVADAPDSLVSAAVTAFPGVGHDSFAHRIARGLRRMGSWVNPTR